MVVHSARLSILIEYFKAFRDFVELDFLKNAL